MNFKTIALGVSTLVLSTSVNAVVLNTLNGVDYQWLELTETVGLSRDTVELRLADVNDELYGYSYPSRQLLEDLLHSYTPFVGVNDWYGDVYALSGTRAFLDDFGVMYSSPGNGINNTLQTYDGYAAMIDGFELSNGLYGTTAECGSIIVSCLTESLLYSDKDGNITATLHGPYYGFYSLSQSYGTQSNSVADAFAGSYLVKTTVVPVPAAVWLFGSGLLGLIGVARRKKS